jgi:hypothetical protein
MPYPSIERGQFFRVEKFAVQAPRGKPGGNDIFKVANEAVRTPGFCPHVENPLPPALVYGVGPLEAAGLAQIWARQKTSQFLHKPSQTIKVRKFRDDKACALVGVISAPPEWSKGPRWTHFVEACMEWIKKKYGEDRLASLLEHHDEPHLHLHFWIIPRPDEDFSAIHPGQRALEIVGPKAVRVIRDIVYKKAMSELLDEFHEIVGMHFGLERVSVSGERLPRVVWLRKQYLDRQRELVVQHRIDQAVASTINDLKRTDSLAKTLENVPAKPDSTAPDDAPGQSMDLKQGQSIKIWTQPKDCQIPDMARPDYPSPEPEEDPASVHSTVTNSELTNGEFIPAPQPTESYRWIRPRGG